MNPEHIQQLEENRPKAERLLKTGGVRNIRIDQLHLIMLQFNPKYVLKEWDDESIIKLVRNVYRHYDEWKAKNPV